MPEQRDGNWVRPEDDNFAIKTSQKQIFQGFKTRKEAEKFGESLAPHLTFEVIDSPWFLDVS